MSVNRIAASVALVLSLSSVARADDKAVCLTASEAGQTARDAKKLEAARKAFVTCSAETCPKVVAASCQQWLSEVTQSQPTVAFRVVDDKGNDLVDVQVLVDGALVQATISGVAIPIDPGPHKVTFQHATLGTAEQSVVVVEGQKGRVVSVELKSKQAPPVEPAVAPRPTTEAPPPPAPPPLAPQARRGSILPYAIGGVGVVSLVASGVFLLSYESKKQTLSDNCHADGTCSASQQGTIDGANRSGTLSVITGVVGVAGLGVGTWLLLSEKAPATTATLSTSGSGGAFATVTHRF